MKVTPPESDKTKFPFEITVEDVLRFLGPDAQLYSDDSRVFIRELVQNALDAVTVQAGRIRKPTYQGEITVRYRVDGQKNAVVVVADNGIGLDDEGLRHLAHPLVGIEEFLGEEIDDDTRSKIIGRFGAGLLSVFKVSDH